MILDDYAIIIIYLYLSCDLYLLCVDYTTCVISFIHPIWFLNNIIEYV